MAFTCALTKEQISSLYTLAMKTAKEKGAEFNTDIFLSELFNSIKENTDAQTAAKFIQAVPKLIVTTLTRIGNKANGPQVLKAFELNSDFIQEDGLDKILEQYNPVTTKQEIKELATKIVEEEISQEESEHFNSMLWPDYFTLNPFSSVMLELDKKDMSNDSITKEVDPNRKGLYNALQAIHTHFIKYPSKDNSFKIKGVQAYYTPMTIGEFQNKFGDEIDQTTKDEIVRAFTLQKLGKSPENFTDVNKIVVLVLTDSQGSPLYIKQEGEDINLGSKDDGQLIYQYLRDSRKTKEGFDITNFHGFRYLPTAEEIVLNKRSVTLEQAEEFLSKVTKAYSNLHNSILEKLSKKEPVKLKITGIDVGLESYQTSHYNDLNFDNINETLNINIDSLLKKGQVLTSNSPNIPKGRLQIINRSEEGVQVISVDRAFLPVDLAPKLGAFVLRTDYNIDTKLRVLQQFFGYIDGVNIHINSDESKPKYGIIEIFAPTHKTINLNKLEAYSLEQVNEIFKTAIEYKRTNVLWSDLDTNPGLRMPYKTELMETNSILIPDSNGELIEDTYTNFIKSLNPNLELHYYSGRNFVHSKLLFETTISEDPLQKELENAEVISSFTLEEVQNPESDVRKNKQELVELLKTPDLGDLNELQVNLNKSVSETDYTQKTKKSQRPYGELELRVKFKDFDKNVYVVIDPTLIPSIKEYLAWGKAVKENSLELELTDIETPDRLITDVIKVYIKKGDQRILVGNIKETAFVIGEKEKTYIKPIEQEVKEKIIDTPVPGETATLDPYSDVDMNTFDLERKKELTQSGVTEDQIKNAENWWSKHPLKKHITLNKAYDIVNSNAYAKFIVAGKTLSDVRIDLYNGATSVDVYHEAWHAFSQLYLTQREKIDLYKEIQKTNPKYSKMSFFEVEEELAESFREFARNNKGSKGTPVKNSIFRKILNFIKALFGNKASISNLYENETVKELFDNLYFADQNPELLKNYNPSINNVLFTELNRSKGVESVKYNNQIALNIQDSKEMASVVDNMLSETIDEIYDIRSNNSTNKFSKAGNILYITKPEARGALYKVIQNKLINMRNELKSKLIFPDTNVLSKINTLEELQQQSVGVIKSNKDNVKDIYVLLSSQVDSYNKLRLSNKNGQRVKGLIYKGSEILADFYMHTEITSLIDGKNKNVEVIIVDSLDTIDTQVKELNKTKDKENGDYSKATYQANKDFVIKELTPQGSSIQDKIRLLDTVLENYGLTQNEDKTFNFEGFVKYHYENSEYKLNEIKVKEIDSEELDASDNSTTDAAKVDRKEVGRESIISSSDKKINYILKSLHKIDKKTGKPILDRFGTKQRVDFKDIFNKLVLLIGGVENPEQVMNILRESSNNIPELKQLLNYKLPTPEQTDNSVEFDITTALWQTFRKYRTPYLQASIFNGNTVQIANATIEVNSVIKKWNSKFKGDISNPYLLRNKDNSLSLNLEKLVTDFKNKVNTPEEQLSFLRAIGIYVDDLSAIKDELAYKAKEFGVPYIFDVFENVYKTVKSKGTQLPATDVKEYKRFLKDPIAVLRGGFSGEAVELSKIPSVKQYYQVTNLAKLNARFSDDSTNFGVLTADKNLVFEHINNHTISMIVKGLNSMDYLSQAWSTSEYKYLSHLNPEVSSFTNRSAILKNLFNFRQPGLPKKNNMRLDLNSDSGTQIIDSETGTNTTSLDAQGKFLQEMHMMLKGGFQEFMRHASKSSSFGVRLNKFTPFNINYQGLHSKDNYNPRLYVPINVVGGTYKKDNVKDLDNYKSYIMDEFFIPYIAHEAERIAKYKTNPKAKFIQGYNRPVKMVVNGVTKEYEAGELFTAFDDILSLAVKKEIANKTLNPETKIYTSLEELVKTDLELKDKITKDVLKYINSQTEQNLKTLEAGKFVSKDLTEKLVGIGVPYEDVDKALIESYTINSWIHNFETANLMYGDIVQYNHAKEEMHKRNTGSTSGGTGFRTDAFAQNYINKHFNTAEKTYAGSLNKQPFVYDGTFNTAIMQDVVRDSVYADQIKEALVKDYTERARKSTLNPEQQKAYIEERVSKELSKYQDNDKSMEEGDGAGYITIDAYRTLKKLEGKWEDEHEFLFNRIIRKQPISAEDIYKFFPPYKVQHFGHLANSNELKLPVNAMHKFALTPIIPSVWEGSELEKLHQQMMDKNIQYAVFQTGSKVGNVTSDGKADKIFKDSNQKEILDIIKFTPNTIYLEYLKNVTEVSDKYKGKVIFSTQLRKLIEEGLYQQGRIANPKFEPIVKSYEKAVNDYSEILKQELLNEIKFTQLEDGTYKGDYSTLMEVVKSEFDRKELPENILKYFDLNMDYSLLPNGDDVEKIIISIADKRLVKQKIKGEALIQVPSSFTNGLWDRGLKSATPEETRKYLGTNNLPFYQLENGKVKAMKVAVALQGDFINLLKVDYKGEPIGTIDRLNEAIKDEEWLNTSNNRRSVTMLGVRIPVQGLNSMENMEVYHFLKPEAGNIIIPPSEIVAKSGGDFDVDKLTIVMPSINSDGTYSFLSDEDSKNFKDIISKASPKEKEYLIKQYKNKFANKLIETSSDILSLEENYATLVRPNDTYLLKPIADRLEKDVVTFDRFKNTDGDYTTDGKKRYISPTRVLEVGYNLHKHEVNMIGKQGLGIIALDNTLNTLFTAVGMSMPLTYTENGFNPFEEVIQHKMNLRLKHNETDEGAISLSHRFDQKGLDSIADVYSQMMNGLVDVEKDAWIFFIQGNLEIIPVLSFLIKAGVSKEEAINFVSNPLVRQYAELQRAYNSSYDEVLPKEDLKEAEKTAKTRALNKLVKDSIFQLSYSNKQNLLLNINKLKAKAALETLVKTKPSVKFFKNKTAQEILNDNKLFEEILSKELTFYSEKLKKNIVAYSPIKNPNSILNTSNYKYTAEYLNSNYPVDKIDINENNPVKNLSVLAHFIELEKQIQGISDLKRLSNPDTSTSKTYQENINKEVSLNEAGKSTKITRDSVDKMKNTVIGAMFDKELLKALVQPVTELVNNPTVTDFIINVLQNNKKEIKERYGTGSNTVSYFVSDFKNSIKNFMFQNFMSNIVDNSGKVVNVPEVFGGKDVKPVVKDTTIDGIVLQDGVYKVNETQVLNDYNNKLYLKTSQAEDSWEKRGLTPFTADYFTNSSTFFKYMFNKAKLLNIYNMENISRNPFYMKLLNFTKDPNTAFDLFINQRALINSFNPTFILNAEKFSYTDMVLDIIKDYPELVNKYPILGQLSETGVAKEKILTLNNRELLEGDLAVTYNQNLRELANPNVVKYTKSGDKENLDNKYISEVFSLFPLMMLYQHGVGKSKFNITNALDLDSYLDIMTNAKKIFKLDNDLLLEIFGKTLSSRSSFKNLVLNDVVEELADEEVTENTTIDSDIKIITEDYGVVQVSSNPTKEFDTLLVDNISHNIKNNAYVENGSSTANLMFSYGWQWKGNNTKTPTGNVLKVQPAEVDYNANGKLTPVKSKYFYDSKYNNGIDVPSITELDFLKRHIESVLNIDMSGYDIALNNIYTEGTNLYRHTDIDESNTAKGYPVIVYVLGNEHKVRIDDNGGKRLAGEMINPKTLTLNNGDIYTFGLNGKGRFEAVHDVIKAPKTIDTFPPITLPDGTVTSIYTITFTFRRAADIEPGMPKTPKKLNTTPTSDPSTDTDLKTFTNYSGGALGGDTIWKNIGKEFGLGKQVDYRPEDLQRLTKEQLQEVENAYQKAVVDLGRKPFPATDFRGGLVRRDYLQAKAADAVFAISDIIMPNEKGKPVKGVRYPNRLNKPVVDGGTGYAVQMAINLSKPVYVFHQGTNSDNLMQVGWYLWNNNQFQKVDPPILSKKFAGIGTREINEAGKQAIRDVYEKTLNNSNTSTDIYSQLGDKTQSSKLESNQSNLQNQITLNFDEPSLEYPIITELYNKQSKEIKEKLGNLAELYKTYASLIELDNITEEEFINIQINKC